MWVVRGVCAFNDLMLSGREGGGVVGAVRFEGGSIGQGVWKE